MVIDHIEDYRDFEFVAGVDERFQTPRATVGGLNRVGINSVVTPVAFAGKLSHRH